MFTYLYEFTFCPASGLPRRQVVVESTASELDAHAQAFSKLSTQERDVCIQTKLKSACPSYKRQ